MRRMLFNNVDTDVRIKQVFHVCLLVGEVQISQMTLVSIQFRGHDCS